MKVYLGSKNIVKINATKEVLEPYGFEVIGLDVDSKVSAQPKCDAETLQGAYNRTVIGSGLYKLTADGTAIGITESYDAIVAPFRAYVRIDNAPQTRATSAPIEIKITQVKY